MRVGWWYELGAAMYTEPFRQAVAAVRSGDPSGLDYVVRFLEADPWCHRSGYIKADLIRYLRRVDLAEPIRAQLRDVVLSIVDDPRYRREFRSFANLAVLVRDDSLRARLEPRLRSENPAVRLHAHWVLAALDRPTGATAQPR